LVKSTLLTFLRCDRCGHELVEQEGALHCEQCHRLVPLQDGVPVFTAAPVDLQPSEKLTRGPEIGTPWRRANWRFLAAQTARLVSGAIILDVGAGRGDFAGLFDGRNYLALDVYPYPEVDIACDLTQSNPFREASFDAILLMNVLEHVYDTHALLSSLAAMLKPGGVLICAIPFLVKMHQEPVDYVRFTHYALEHLGPQQGLKLELLEGFYDPISLLGEGIGNLKWAVLPETRGLRHYAGRFLLAGMEVIASALGLLTGPGGLRPPQAARSHAPTGYHVVYRKIS
jgi:SAM-dependent methyltransferase